jgi:hypothetical protein
MVDPAEVESQKNGKQNNHWWDWVELGSLWPFIPGAVFTLIGVCFLLYDNNTVHGVIVCYVGLMALIVAAGIIWTQSIPRQHEQHATEQPFHAATLRAQSVNVILMTCCFVGIVITGLTIVSLATVTVFKDRTATGLLWALGTLISGGFVGLLFAIPSENEPKESKVQINTSLNQIADWLTKIIVGVSLVNAKDAYKFFLDAVRALGAGLAMSDGQLPGAKAFAGGLIITFPVLGFTGTYLLARVWLTTAIVRADQLALTLAHDENAKRDRADRKVEQEKQQLLLQQEAERESRGDFSQAPGLTAKQREEAGKRWAEGHAGQGATPAQQ